MVHEGVQVKFCFESEIFNDTAHHKPYKCHKTSNKCTVSLGKEEKCHNKIVLILAAEWGVPYGLVVRIPAFHAGGPGSIPGVGARTF